jgi:ABC-type multidrug transport system ATPase subunit
MELMADRVGIILAGTIRRQGKLSELIARSTQYVEVVCDRIGEKELARIQAGFTSRDGRFIITLASDADVNLVVESIIHNSGRILAVHPVKMTLEDIFFSEMTGGSYGVPTSRSNGTGEPRRPATGGKP